MKQLGILFLAGVVLISAGCMKKKSALNTNLGSALSGPELGTDGNASTYNPMNPTLYRGEECPNGVTIEIQPPAPPLNANADLAFTVVASGCKYGYDMETNGQTISLAPSLTQPQLDPTAEPYRASFVRNFSRSGSNTVSVNLMPKNRSNAYTVFFVSHLSIDLEAELPGAGPGAFTCTVEPSQFSVPINSNSFQTVFTVHSTAASTSAPKLTTVTGVEGYSSVSQRFSNVSVPTSSGVQVTVPGQSSGTLKFKVETNDGHSAECLSSGAPRSTEAVTGNFVGRAANETIRDRFYLTDIVSNGHRRAMANYAREDGLYESKLVSPTFPNNAIPQRFLAGDLDNDGKDDVIYFRNGQAFWLKAKGSSDADYDFDLPQQIGNAPWQISNLNNQIIASLRFEKGSGTALHQLKATINGKLYLSTISTASISQPVEYIPTPRVDLELVGVGSNLLPIVNDHSQVGSPHMNIATDPSTEEYSILVGTNAIPITYSAGRAGVTKPGGGWHAVAAKSIGSGYELLWDHPKQKRNYYWTLNNDGVQTGGEEITPDQYRLWLNLAEFSFQRIKGPNYSIRVGESFIPITYSAGEGEVNRAGATKPGEGWYALAAKSIGAGYELLWYRNNMLKETEEKAYWILNNQGRKIGAGYLTTAHFLQRLNESAFADLNWSGEAVSNCKLLRCDASSNPSCNPNTIMNEISLGVPRTAGAAIRVPTLNRTTAFRVSCDAGKQSAIVIAGETNEID